MNAWLVTWEWDGEHARVEEPIATVLNYRLSGEHVREIVEIIYVNEWFSLAERLAYARNKQDHPYPAKFAQIEGITWQGQIFCGGNPYLFARLVNDLRVASDEIGHEQLIWKERPIPDSVAKFAARLRGGVSDRLRSPTTTGWPC